MFTMLEPLPPLAPNMSVTVSAISRLCSPCIVLCLKPDGLQEDTTVLHMLLHVIVEFHGDKQHPLGKQPGYRYQCRCFKHSQE